MTLRERIMYWGNQAWNAKTPRKRHKANKTYTRLCLEFMKDEIFDVYRKVINR